MYYFYRNKLEDRDVQEAVGILYSDYRYSEKGHPLIKYWEAWYMIRKLLLTALIVYIAQGTIWQVRKSDNLRVKGKKKDGKKKREPKSNNSPSADFRGHFSVRSCLITAPYRATILQQRRVSVGVYVVFCDRFYVFCSSNDKGTLFLLSTF